MRTEDQFAQIIEALTSIACTRQEHCCLLREHGMTLDTLLDNQMRLHRTCAAIDAEVELSS